VLQVKFEQEQKREFVVEIENLCTKNISDIKSCQLVLKDALSHADNLIRDAEQIHGSIHSGWKALTILGGLALLATGPPAIAIAAVGTSAGLSAYNIGAE